MAKGNQPCAKFRLGYVNATVWQNGDGSKFYSVKLSRSYKDDDGDWKETDSFGHGDILNAAKALTRAEEWISAQD